MRLFTNGVLQIGVSYSTKVIVNSFLVQIVIKSFLFNPYFQFIFAVLKSRIHEHKSSTSQLKLRSFRLLHGKLSRSESPIIVEINSNLSNSLIVEQETVGQTGGQTGGHASQEHVQARRRYFIMGSESSSGQLVATFVMPWPHKSAQLRKALKAIKNGNIKCPEIKAEEKFEAEKNGGKVEEPKTKSEDKIKNHEESSLTTSATINVTSYSSTSTLSPLSQISVTTEVTTLPTVPTTIKEDPKMRLREERRQAKKERRKLRKEEREKIRNQNQERRRNNNNNKEKNN